MSSPRFNLQKEIAAWRRTLEYNRAYLPDDLDELEQHVRDQVAGFAQYGLTEEEALARAMEEMGDYGSTETEYHKVYWGKLKRQHQIGDGLTWRSAMFKNYLKIALRTLLRKKGYSFLNVAGLTLGMACCLVIFQYVAYEYSFDRFNDKADQIYRLDRVISQNGSYQNTNAFFAWKVGPTLTEQAPGIERFARIHPNFAEAIITNTSEKDKVFKEGRVYFADPSLLSIFSFPIVRGSRSAALTQPHTMAISAQVARKYFGQTDPIGKVLNFRGWISGDYTVTTVFQDVPVTSHLQFDFLLPMQDLLAESDYKDESSGWNWNNFYTYFEIRKGTDVADLNRTLTAIYADHTQEARAAGITTQISLEPLKHVHLNGDLIAPATAGGNYKTVYFFTVIALITLAIALVNYVNLSTARAFDRAKEVGVRKVVGANRKQLVTQFLFESALINVAALVFAIGLTFALVPLVERVADVHLTNALWTDPRFWGAFAIVFGVGAVLSGVYPAFVLSAFQPVRVLKGRVSAIPSRFTLRRVLVVIQFAASIALLAGTIIVYAQLNKVRHMDLGMSLNQVLVIDAPRVLAEGTDETAAVNTFRQEALQLPGVLKVATSNAVPGKGFNWYTMVRRTTDDPTASKDARAAGIDRYFNDLYGIPLVAGQLFKEGMRRSDSTSSPVLINETAVKVLGYENPEEAIDKELNVGDEPFTIRGVVEDFNWTSAHERQVPVLLYPVLAGSDISLKVGTADLHRTIASVQTLYETLFPGNPFDYYFADAAFDAQYKNDERFATLFGVFAGIAILIACLGLFGLAAFTAESHTKEIGVRKVLGATVPSIVGLLSKDFVKLVVIAFVVAVPVTYFLMSRWLNEFAYRIELGPGVFLLAGVMALIIAMATVSYQAVRAAIADPVKSLRYE